MPPQADDIRPRTRALDALIRRTVAQVQNTANAADALLFLGDRHDAFPARLVQDPVLEPVDKVVWMIVCQQGRTGGTCTAFPRYEVIAHQANIASTATVSRAITILRVTRWLSLCTRVRDSGSYLHGYVYALHDEPLPLADALHLDPDYLTFVNRACKHHHARVRKVAGVVLASLEKSAETGVDVIASANLAARRFEARQVSREGGLQQVFSFSAAVSARLANQAPTVPVADGDQKPQAICSSDINTTTDRDRACEANDDQGFASLIYPRRLAANQRETAARQLADIPEAQRQIVLDELEGRLRAEQQGASLVRDELRYLGHLCAKVNAGRFQASMGFKVQAERARRAQEAEERRREAQALAAQRRRLRQQKRDRAGESPLAEARKALRLKRPSR